MRMSANRLPLGIIDWHGKTSKFDSGPSVSSLLSLSLARRLSLEAAADASVRVVDTDPAHNARERVEEREERER